MVIEKGIFKASSYTML